MKNKSLPYVSWNDYIERELKDPRFRAAYEAAGERIEAAYAITVMRHKKRMTQKEMAKRLKISQSAVARIEQGGQNLTIETLSKIAALFGKKVKIKFV
jgi:DNA-binding XRE family transcriptional regulator